MLEDQMAAAAAFAKQVGGCPFGRATVQVVGEGRAGKSALVLHFLKQPFEQSDSTVGIETFDVQVNSPF